MAVTDQQKLDFLLKKIGYTKTKTGSVVGTGAISGTPKQPFAEAIPSPLVVPNSSLWNEAASIPATPPGSDTAQVKVYLAASSGLRMTADSTSSGQRAYIAYSTYGNASSTRLTNWIDTQFGSAYLIKVYKGDPNSGGVALSAAGSGANDGWFFDYSAGVLNFNDTNVPSGVTDTNIYIVGYRYIGQTGAPTSGISTFSHLDLTVERNLDVGKQGGLSTFRHNVQLLDNDKLQFGSSQDLEIYHDSNHSYIDDTGTGNLKIRSGTIEVSNLAGSKTSAVFNSASSQDLYFNDTKRFETTNTGINVIGDGVFSGNVSIGGTLTYEDVKNVDAVGLITARSGIRVTGGVIEAQAGENKIPSLYSNMGALPSAGSYHGMFAHVHATGRGYFAHAGNWLELVNKELNGVVGTGTETYNIGNLVSTSSTVSSLNVSGVTTTVSLDVNGDIDVDGHTNLDNVSVAGVSTFTNDIIVNGLTVGKGANSASNNTVLGADALDAAVSGQNNTAVGAYALTSNTSGQANTAMGSGALFDVQTGQQNTALGRRAMRYTTASNNTAVGADALFSNNSGQQNTTAGTLAGYNLVSGSNNLILGYNAQATATNTSNEITLGNSNITHLRVPGIGVSFSEGGAFISGIVTATELDISGDIDVDGHTNLDNVSIAGVTSVASLTSGRVVTAGTGGKLQDSNNLTFDGTNLFVSGINVTQPGSGTTSILGADIVTRNLKATGLSTFVGQSEFDGNAKFDSTITAGGSTGTNGQYLKTTGSGVEWASFPTLRTRQTFTASAGQTAFSFSYTINFIDVFVNGIKLTDAEFTATNGSTVVLAVGCFVGDIVELVSYNTVSGGGGGGGGGGISNVVEDTTPQLGGNLDLFNKSITGTGNVNITGIITATNFVGDGSGLTNVIGSGSGIIIRDNNQPIGTAGTINFGDNLSVSPISAGIVTITGSAGVTTSQFDVGKLHVSGITTFAGITTFNNSVSFRPPINGQVNFYGSVEGQRLRWQNNGSNVGLYFNNNVVSYYGNDNRTQISPHGNGGSSDHFRIWQYRPDGKENQLQISSDFINIIGAAYGSHQSRDIAKINYHDGTSLYHFGNKKFQTSGVGVTVTGSLDVSEVRSDALSLKNAAGGATYATFSNGGSATLKWNNTDRLQTTNAGITITGTATATAFVGDGSGLTNVSAAGISTTNLRADTLVVGENNNVAVSTFHNRVHIPTNDTIFFGDGLDASISYPTAGYFYISGGSSGDMVIQTGGNRKIQIEASGDFEVDTGSNEIAIRANKDGAVQLFQNGYGAPEGERFRTTGVGVSVIGITSMTDNLMVGTGVTATTDGNAFFAGIVTATSFIGDGGGLTNVIGSGSGVVIKEGGSTVGTAGTINFVGVDVTDVSAGVVTVSTATTSITDGNSKLFVNNVSSSMGNGSFEVFLNEFTYGGTREALNMHQPSDGYARVDLFHGAQPQTIEVNAKTVYSGSARHRLKFDTSNASYGGQLDFIGATGAWLFYSTYQGTQKNVMNFGYNYITHGGDAMYPLSNNATDLGLSNFKYRQFHVTGVNAGVVTATSFVGDGSQLTNLPGGGGGGNIGITTNISGSFTASAGTPATINTFTGYSSDDLVIEYTIYIKNGSDFQTQKLLAMRDGTTIHSTQFAVMFSSSLLVQCDATISSGNILLRATPETGVSGSTTYKIKREVM